MSIGSYGVDVKYKLNQFIHLPLSQSIILAPEQVNKSVNIKVEKYFISSPYISQRGQNIQSVKLRTYRAYVQYRLTGHTEFTTN